MAVYWTDENQVDEDLVRLHEEGNCPCDVCRSEREEKAREDVPLGDEPPSEHDLLTGQGLY